MFLIQESNSVFINSLPKSGTHLLAKCLALMGFQSGSKVCIAADLSVGGTLGITLLKHILHNSLLARNRVNVGIDVSAYVTERSVTSILAKVKSHGGQNYILGHAPYSDLLLNILNTQGFKTLFIMRDPRDVIVSWAYYVYQHSFHFAYSGHVGKSFEDRVKLILDGGYMPNGLYLESFASILHVISGWLSARDVLVIRFEDLVGKQGGGNDERQQHAIKLIADFVGMDNVRPEDIASQLFGNSKTFRKGKIGSWYQELSPDLQAMVNDRIGHILPVFGYAN